MYPLGPRYHPAAKAAGEKFIVYPPRQTYLLHTRLCQEIIDALIDNDDEERRREHEQQQALQGSIAASLRGGQRSGSKVSSPSRAGRRSTAAGTAGGAIGGPLGMPFVLAVGSSGNNNIGEPKKKPNGSGNSQSGGGPSASPSSPLPPRKLPKLPPAGSFALQSAALGQINATIPYDASAHQAIAAIFEQIGYSDRPVEDFVMYQTFADFSPDFTTVPMYGEGQPVRLAMKFPYYVYVTISPFVRERDNVMHRLEPLARAAIENERSVFRSFAHGYAQILHQMAKAYHSLYENEMRTRMLKKVQERQHFFTVSLFQLLGNESKDRYMLKFEEKCAWDRLMCLWEATSTHQLFIEHQFDCFTKEREAIRKIFDRNAFEIRLLKTLRERMENLRKSLALLLSEHCATTRNLYTESRMVGNFVASNEVGLHQMDFQLLRQVAARERNPHLYPEDTTTTMNHLAVNSDVFSCTRFSGTYPRVAVEDEWEQQRAVKEAEERSQHLKKEKERLLLKQSVRHEEAAAIASLAVAEEEWVQRLKRRGEDY